MNSSSPIRPFSGHFRRLRPIGAVLLVSLSVSILLACSERDRSDAQKTSEPATGNSALEARPDRQTAFRVRSDAAAPLNADEGWAGKLNEAVTVPADQPFRLRLEAAVPGESSGPRRYRLEFRRNDGAWQPLPAENFPQPEKVHELDMAPASDGTFDSVWQIIEGDAAPLQWQSADGRDYLHIEQTDSPLLALGRYATQWQAREFELVLRFHGGNLGSAGLVFALDDADNHARAEVDGAGKVRVVRVVDGRESVIAEHDAEAPAERWVELKAIVTPNGAGHKVMVEFDDEALVFTATIAEALPGPRLGIYRPAGTAVDFRGLRVEGEPRSPRTSIIASAAFDLGAPTQDLLPASDLPFSGGAGVSFAEYTPMWQAGGGHGEWEFPIVIRRFSDEAAVNEAGDRFEYRLAVTGGKRLPTDGPASVTLDVPDGHLGGVFVETPMRIGPWQADSGELYFLMEPAETWNALMTVKSSDDGNSWREVDGEHRPETGDLEGFASVLVDDRIHMLHQTSDAVFYHVFRTSDHSDDPDGWAIRDERVATPREPPTQVADIAVRSDGSVVVVYGGPNKIHYRIRSARGQWGDERIVDGDKPEQLSGPTIVLGADDLVHMAYTSRDGSAWYRRLLPDGQLTARVRFSSELGTKSEDVGSILPLLYLPQRDSVSAIYRTREGRLYERRVDADGNWSDPLIVSDQAVVQNSVDSDQVGADAIVHGDTVHVLFIEDGTGRLLHAARHNETWRNPRVLVEDDEVQWVRGNLAELPDGRPAYGYVYDAGSDGGSGKNRYARIPLETP